MTSYRSAAPLPRPADFLLSWDRLGFRSLLFGGLALLWIAQGRVLDVPWPTLVLGELKGMLPWVLLAPLVLTLSRRVRIERLGLGRFLAAHALGVAVVSIPLWLAQRLIHLVWEGFASGWQLARLATAMSIVPSLAHTLLNAPFIYLLILLGAEAMQHAQARREEELQAERLAGQLTEARLALLQRQLHPHFLFNALQAVSTLLHRDPGTADGLLVRLSSLLRAMLVGASGQILTLKTEMDLIRGYLDIEQVRFIDRLCIEWCVDPCLLDTRVPSLVVLPLVENAVRHGLAPKVGPGRLTITAAAGEGGSMVLAVEDDGLGAALPLRRGVGLANTEERLAALYGERAGLAIETALGRGFCASIRLPLERERP